MAYNNYSPYVKDGTGVNQVYFTAHWERITGRPTNFAPTAHNHDASNITSGTISNSRLPSTFVNLTDGKSNLPYKGSIIVYGDRDKYYPVHFAKGDQNLLRTIKIWRRHAEQAPNDWYTSTHKGSLNLEWKGNYGNWGGAVYNQWIYENTSAYTTLLAGTQLVDNSYAMAFFLRGGGTTGAIYHFASDQPLTWADSYLTYTEPTAFYNQEKTFEPPTSGYERYAPAPRTAVDVNQINSITVIKGDDSRLTNSRPASDVSEWAKASSKPSYNLDEISDGTTYKRFSSIKVGTITYNPSSGVVSLPAYPTGGGETYSKITSIMEQGNWFSLHPTARFLEILYYKNSNKTSRETWWLSREMILNNPLGGSSTIVSGNMLELYNDGTGVLQINALGNADDIYIIQHCYS